MSNVSMRREKHQTERREQCVVEVKIERAWGGPHKEREYAKIQCLNSEKGKERPSSCFEEKSR